MDAAEWFAFMVIKQPRKETATTELRTEMFVSCDPVVGVRRLNGDDEMPARRPPPPPASGTRPRTTIRNTGRVTDVLRFVDQMRGGDTKKRPHEDTEPEEDDAGAVFTLQVGCRCRTTARP